MLLNLILGFSIYASAAPSCNADQLLEKTCQFYKDHEKEAYIKTSNGQHFPNPLFRGKSGATKPKSTENQKDRIERLLTYAKTQVIDLIKMGRKDTQLSIEQNNLIKKIESIEQLPENDPLILSLGRCINEPDAFYLQKSHTLTVCKEFTEYPDAQIVSMLAHELGHAVGPCATENPLLKIDLDKLDSLQEDISGKDDDEESDLEKALKELGKFDIKFTNQIHLLDFKTEPHKTLAERNVYKIEAPPVPMKKHPFENVRSCLVSNEGISEITEQDIKADINKAIKEKKLTGKSLQDYIYAAKRKRNCDGTSLKFPKIEEGMADFYGGYALAKYYKDYPPKTQNDVMAGISLYSFAHCSGADKDDEKMPDFILKPHQVSGKRLKANFFKMPGVAEAFGCELKPKSKCFNNIEFLLKSGSKIKVQSPEEMQQ